MIPSGPKLHTNARSDLEQLHIVTDIKGQLHIVTDTKGQLHKSLILMDNYI